MEQHELLGKVVSVLRGDARVRAAWLAGSRARGTSDRYSDTDIWAVTAARDRTALLADWPAIAPAVSPLVLCRRVGLLPVYTHVTPGWERYDIVFGVTADVPGRDRSSVRLLFDRDGLDALLGGPAPARQPDPVKVEATVTEFLRVLGLLPVVIGRAEYVAAASGAGLLRDLLIRLMTEGSAVADPGGALKLAGVLTPEQLAALAGLPPIQAAREPAIAAHLACARIFLPYARELAARAGARWPGDLEDAARRHLSRALSVTV